MNRKVFIVTEIKDFCIGTLGQIMSSRANVQELYEVLRDVLREMICDEAIDVDSIEFTVEIRN